MKSLYLFILFLFTIQISRSQDTVIVRQDSLVLNLHQVEDSFLTKNLALIAQKYSIDSARATVITARLYDNPDFEYSNQFYNTVNHKFFDVERSFQISQLVRLAGKRNRAIELAKSGIGIAEFEFYDLLRTLRYVVRNDFYTIYFLEQSSRLYQLEITTLTQLIPVFEEQVKKGNIAFRELIRIKSQLYTLQAEFNDLQTNIDNTQGELKFLIRGDPNTFIVADANTSALNQDVVSRLLFPALVDSAINNRPDLKLLQEATVYSNNNLKLQQALARPDITLNIYYDRLGSYVPDYNAVGIGFPIPLFNHNQGNIRNAKIQIEVNKVMYENGIDKVKNDVTTNYITALRAEKLLLSFDPNFDSDLEHFIGGVFTNFQKRNITMLEFLDFYESYKQNVLQINKLRLNKMNALEQLNFSIGKIIFNP